MGDQALARCSTGKTGCCHHCQDLHGRQSMCIRRTPETFPCKGTASRGLCEAAANEVPRHAADTRSPGCVELRKLCGMQGPSSSYTAHQKLGSKVLKAFQSMPQPEATLLFSRNVARMVGGAE